MILSIENSNAPLQDYGIQIPLLAERYTNTLAAVRAHPELSRCTERWLKVADPLAFTRDQLLRVHDAKYIDALLSENPLEVLGEVFEFVDADGNFNERYIETTANRPICPDWMRRGSPNVQLKLHTAMVRSILISRNRVIYILFELKDCTTKKS